MKTKMTDSTKPAISIITIFLFLWAASASIGPDASTNTVVAIDTSKCMLKPQISSPYSVDLLHRDKTNGMPIAFAEGDILITFQNVTGPECKYDDIFRQRFSFTTDVQGRYTFDGIPHQQTNAADLIRIEARIADSDVHEGANAIGVAYYGPANFSFRTFSLKKSEL